MPIQAQPVSPSPAAEAQASIAESRRIIAKARRQRDELQETIEASRRCADESRQLLRSLKLIAGYRAPVA